MDYREYRLLYKRAEVFKRESFDISEFLDTAKDDDVLDETTADKVKVITYTENDAELYRLRVFMFDLAKCMSFSSFLRVLELGIHKRLARELRFKRYGVVDCIYTVNKQVDDSSKWVDLFSNMKRRVDNREYPNLLVYFESLTTRAYYELSKCQNAFQVNTMANQIGVLTWLQTQLYRDPNKRVLILDDFRRILKHAQLSDTSFVDTVYYCKMVCTAELCGEFDAALRYMQQAEKQAERCKSPFARTMVHHDRQFIYRKYNVDHRHPSNVKQIIISCERGLDSLENIPGENQILLKRIFLLNMVQALLGIGTFLEIDMNETVEQPNIKRATSLLKEVERLTKVHTMEKRRNMLYLLCKGKLAELTHSENEALEYVNESEQLTKKGAILSELETKNIEAYMDNIDR